MHLYNVGGREEGLWDHRPHVLQSMFHRKLPQLFLWYRDGEEKASFPVGNASFDNCSPNSLFSLLKSQEVSDGKQILIESKSKIFIRGGWQVNRAADRERWFVIVVVGAEHGRKLWERKSLLWEEFLFFLQYLTFLSWWQCSDKTHATQELT